MCMLFKYLAQRKETKKYKNIIDHIMSCLDDNMIAKINKKCEAYITYTIDNKQLNKKSSIKDRRKEFLYLQELCKAQAAFNAFELSTKQTSVSETIKSTFNEAQSTPVKESKKKESK